MNLFKRLILAFLLIVSPVLFLSPANAVEVPCDTYQVNGGDEAFLMNLNTPLEFGGTVYNGNVYVSPKGTITFGQGDYTFWDYPATPSISIGSYDYHAFANGVMWGANNNLYVRYGSTANAICVDWKVMLWGQSTGEPVYIRMIAEVNPTNYTWTPTYQVSSNAPGGARYGVRYTYGGPVQPLTIQTITEPPAPNPTVEPTLEPTPEPTPTPTPTETSTEPPVDPTPEPTQQTPEPSPSPTEEPSPSPTPSPAPSTSESSGQGPSIPAPVQPEPHQPAPTHPSEEVIPAVSPSPTPAPSVPTVDPSPTPSTVEELLTEYTAEEVIPFEVLMASGIDYSELPPDQQVTLENGVVITAGVADALQLFEDPNELIGALFNDPGKVLTAISNVGADLPPEVRKTAQQGTVAVILVGQIIVGGVVAAQLIRR